MADPRLEQVRKLVEAGRYDVARSVLRKIDDPTAKSWLKKLNKVAPATKQKPSINWMIPLLVVGISAGVVIMILVFQYLPQFIEKVIQPDLPDEYGVSIEEEYYAELVHYCTQTTGYGGGELCLDWADIVMAEHHRDASNCLETAYADTQQGFTDFGICLSQHTVPNFFGQ